MEKVLKEWNDKKAKAEELENQIANRNDQIAERQGQLDALVEELNVSRTKAQNINDELAKVGIFLQNSTPRKPKDRPRSGTKSGDATSLPKIAPGRPQSGQRNKGPAPKGAWDDGSSYQSQYQ